MAAMFLHLNAESPKRGIMQKVVWCYDPVGLVAPILLVGNSIYRNFCKIKVSLDQPLPEA